MFNSSCDKFCLSENLSYYSLTESNPMNEVPI